MEIAPKPADHKYYHIMVMVCDGPGYKDPRSGTLSVWDCGTNETHNRFTGLPRAEQCASSDVPHASFKYQFQGGSRDDGTLRLPSGTGVPVGGTKGTKAIVFGFHFPSRNQSVDETTGETQVDVTLIRNQTGMKATSSLRMGGFGFLGAHSVSNISASWTMNQDIPAHPSVVYTHAHSLVTWTKVLVQRKNGEQQLIHESNPNSYKGLTTVAHELEPMRLGDKLVVECEYNNTQSKNVRVW